MALQLGVTLVAKPSEFTPVRWTVDIFVEGRLASSGTRLTNPINDEQEKGIKWFLETYATSSPYTNISTARQTIAGYAKAICDELDFHSVIPKEKDGKPVTIVSLEVLDESREPQVKSTIHQLHWELLEHPDTLGEGGPRILIRRSLPVIEQATKSLHRVTTWSNNESGVQSINILLVIARDLTFNSAKYNDISPWTAYDVLSGVKRHLAARNSPIRINVEIVRPGTLKAFQSHLATSEEKHGQAYFHIVHFDLHGSVKKDNKGYLYFNSPTEDGTVEVPAVKVANTLNDYKVPWVVLNACETARTNAGDDANIATIFRSRGVRNVLAMSYKISSSAAEIFLQALYTSLLTEGATFSVAARSGRDALRLSPQRGARFRLLRDVTDWFVPVLYSSQEEAVIKSPNQDSLQSPRIGESLLISHDSSSAGPQLWGRDFDLLRLEKMLIQQKIIFLHGPSGGGKTFLLKHARNLWIETDFLDFIVYLDLKVHQEAFSKVRFENVILNRLSRTTHASDYDMSAVSSWDKITKILKDRRTAIIVDNMNAALTVLGSHKAALHSSHAYDVLSVCQKMVEFASKHSCFVIFADTRERFQTPLSDRTGHTFEKGLNTYQLDGIDLSAATDLAYTILKEIGFNTAEWKSQDRTQLQLILEALQCLPETLHKILPLANTCDTPWSSFYTTLICNTHRITKYIPATDSCGVWKVLRWARQVQPSGVFRCLMLLGAYWYEAPGDDFLKVVEIVKCIGSDEESLRSAVILTIDRGLVAERKNDCYRVHPLFTIFSRTWEIWDQSMTKMGRVFQGIRNLAWSGSPPDHWFIRALCEPSMDRMKYNPKEKEFVAAFMQSVDAQDAARALVTGLQGSDYQDMVLTYPTKFPILLTFIRICRAAGEALQLEQWPRQFLVNNTNNIRMTGRVPEMALFAQEYEFLLNDVINRAAPKGSKAIPPQHLFFALILANYLSSTYLSDVSAAKDRSKEFTDLALEIGDQSEPVGGYQDPIIIYVRGLTFRHKFMLVSTQASSKNIDLTINLIEKYWSLSEKNDEKYIDALDKAQKDDLPSMVGGIELPEEIKAFLPKVASQPVQRAYVASRKQMAAFKDALISQLRSGNPGSADEKIKLALRQFSKGQVGVHTALEEFGFQNLRQQTAWVPPDLNFTKYYNALKTEKRQLKDLATALDEGDNQKAIGAHRALFKNALKKKDFDEALEHLDSAQELYIGNPQYYEQPERQNGQVNDDNAKRTMQAAFDALSDKSVGSTEEEGLRRYNQLVAALKSQGHPELDDWIRGLELGGDQWKQSLERNAAEPVDNAHDLGIRVKKMQKEVLKLVSENLSDREAMQRMFQIALEIQKSFLERKKAQDDDNDVEEIEIIDRQLQYAETDTGKAMRDILDPEELKKDRDNIKLRRDWKRMMDAGNFNGARVLLKSASERDSGKLLKKFWPVTEESQLLLETVKAEAEAKSESPSVSRFDRLLEMQANGDFSHMNQEAVESHIKVARHNRSWALSGLAIQKKDYETAIACLNDCLINAGEDLRLNPRKYDTVIDLKETAEVSLHTSELDRKDKDCEYGDAQRHIDALRMLIERREGKISPEVRRSLPSITWTSELLDHAQNQLDRKKIILRIFGPENGKAFILASRSSSK